MDKICISIDEDEVNIFYKEFEESVEICGIESDLEEINLVIPEYINNKKVETFYDTAFCGCSNLKKIIIPGSIKKITQRSIQGCDALTEVILNEGVEEIGAYTFWGNTNIEKIKFPSTLKKIYRRAFSSSDKFKYLNLNEGLEEIEKNNFKFLDLDYLYIPSTLEKIGDKVLYGSIIKTTVFKGTMEAFKILKDKFTNVDFGKILCIM